MSIDIEQLKSWIGRAEVRTDMLAATPVQGLLAMLDHDSGEPLPGGRAPHCGHWLYSFTPIPRQSQLGPDGHPLRGGFLPPIPFPRRMWAGSQIQFTHPLLIGEALQRRSTITDVRLKEGRSGVLIFVRVRHEVGNGHEVALVEDQDLVYRDDPDKSATVNAAAMAPAESQFSRTIHAEPTLLFRYSALTHNGHRIHYDRPYAMEVERYPGLVVHGPLIATLLLDLLARHGPQNELARFSFRAVKPLFDTEAFKVCGSVEPDGRSVRLWAQNAGGELAMDATAVLR